MQRIHSKAFLFLKAGLRRMVATQTCGCPGLHAMVYNGGKATNGNDQSDVLVCFSTNLSKKCQHTSSISIPNTGTTASLHTGTNHKEPSQNPCESSVYTEFPPENSHPDDAQWLAMNFTKNSCQDAAYKSIPDTVTRDFVHTNHENPSKKTSEWFLLQNIEDIQKNLELGDILEFDCGCHIRRWVACVSVENAAGVYVTDLESPNCQKPLSGAIVGTCRVRINNILDNVYTPAPNHIDCRYGVKLEKQKNCFLNAFEGILSSKILVVVAASGITGFWVGDASYGIAGAGLGATILLAMEFLPAALEQMATGGR